MLRPNTLQKEEEKKPNFFIRLTNWADKHAKLVIFISTILIIVIVLIFIQHFYSKSQISRAEAELTDAIMLEDFEALKERYKKTPVLPKIMYRLANKYYELGKLDKAKAEYEEFKQRFSTHPLILHVDGAYQRLLKDIEWLNIEKDKLSTMLRLDTHPFNKITNSDPRGQMGPVRESLTQVEIATTKGIIVIELFDDEAPDNVKNFIKLVDEKFYDGCKWIIVNTDERVMPEIKNKTISQLLLEITSREPIPGSLVMVRGEKGVENSNCEFQILLKDVPSLKNNVTIFGVVIDGFEKLKPLTKDDSIQKITVTKRRGTKQGVKE